MDSSDHRGLDTPELQSQNCDQRASSLERLPVRVLGFISRRPETLFQVHTSDGAAEAAGWWVTQGTRTLECDTVNIVGPA